MHYTTVFFGRPCKKISVNPNFSMIKYLVLPAGESDPGFPCLNYNIAWIFRYVKGGLSEPVHFTLDLPENLCYLSRPSCIMDSSP